MGRPKPLLPVGATTLLEWMIDRLGPHFAETLVAAGAARGRLPERLAAHVVLDLHLGAGPLAGVEAALSVARYEVVLAVACDMPHVTPHLARALVTACESFDAAVPRLGHRPEPACAAYARAAAGPIAAALARQRLRAADVLAELNVRYLDEAELAHVGAGPQTFANLNTPAEYQEFVEGLRRQA